MVEEFYFNSHDTASKEPFGAVLPGREITFKVRLRANTNPRVFLRVFKEEAEDTDITYQGENYTIEMIRDGNQYKGSFTPTKIGLYFYYFIVEDEARRLFYGNSHDSKGGLSIYYERDYELRPFQITCHNYRKKAPSWYKEAIFYQIFPDRFCNGNEEGKVDGIKENSFIYGSWYDLPYYVRNERGAIERWDFKGGNLKGIRSKIGYLKEMGITGIYLNPIFLARSNHRYDTGDYHKIDPMVGTLEEFVSLLEELRENGIRVILDGVFNHTGADSIYFNKENTYPSLGAYQSKDSPYYNWYNFKNYPGEYECWWGVTDLPNVNEESESYRDFILNKDKGVISYWIKKGIAGWRLDVADELPDSFIKGIRTTMEEMETDEDESSLILIGEVWEDASNKIAYSKRRKYFLGEELHGVMNYPFKDALIAYLNHSIRAEDIYRQLMSLLENYPKEAFYSSLNSLSTHDTRRIRTELNNLALEKTAAFTLLTMPGVPCIYYGDEAGLYGERDPYNRASYPWGRESLDHLKIYREAINVRRRDRVYIDGLFIPFFQGTIFGFIRYYEDSKVGKAVVLNREPYKQVLNIKVKAYDRYFTIIENIDGEAIKIIDINAD